MKKILSVLFALALCLGMSVPAFAADLPLMMDDAGLLSESEAANLESYFEEVTERQQFEVAVVTMRSLGNLTAAEAVEYVYDTYHYGYGDTYDGVLLLICPEERDWALTSFGFGQTAINQDAHEYITDEILDYLHEDDYYAAFATYAELVDELVESARNGHPYTEPFNFVGALGASLVIGLLVGILGTLRLKSQLRSVYMQAAAADYVVPGSLNVTRANERYLYSTVSRSAKPKKSSSGGGSSGHTTSSGKY